MREFILKISYALVTQINDAMGSVFWMDQVESLCLDVYVTGVPRRSYAMIERIVKGRQWRKCTVR